MRISSLGYRNRQGLTLPIILITGRSVVGNSDHQSLSARIL